MLREYVKTDRKGVYIAEIGLNHNGSVDNAVRLVDLAKRAGADIVKFQIINPQLLVSPYYGSLINNDSYMTEDNTVIDFFNRFVLNGEEYRTIKKYTEQKNIIFMVSVFDHIGVELALDLGVDIIKLASSELTNHDLIREVASSGRPLVLSTGMSYEHEIDMAVDLFKTVSNSGLCLMHCVSLYPAPDERLNLKRITQLKNRYLCEVGFSDHTGELYAQALAVAAGATVFEKHFTIDRNYECPDKDVSITCDEFQDYIQAAERAFTMYGDGTFEFSEEEGLVALSARRSLFAGRDLSVGHIINEDDIIALRPGVGIPVYKKNEIIGKTTKTEIPKNYLIKKEFFE